MIITRSKADENSLLVRKDRIRTIAMGPIVIEHVESSPTCM